MREQVASVLCRNCKAYGYDGIYIYIYTQKGKKKRPPSSSPEKNFGVDIINRLQERVGLDSLDLLTLRFGDLQL